MKINKIKALVGVLATSAVVSLVGSISGTVAWLQYNTRARVEMYGTTAKTTENLQIRLVKNASGTPIQGKFADAAARDLAITAPADGNKVILESDNKVYTYSVGSSSWDSGVAAVTGTKYDVNGTVYQWDGSAWNAITKEYGEWKSTLLPADINEAASHKLANDEFKPITNPTATNGSGLSANFYSHPLAGHETYSGGQHNWKPASSTDYIQFEVQFRVLDIDGIDGDGTLAKDLYLTDFSVNDTVVGKSVAGALRIHLHDQTHTTYKLLGLGDTENNATYSYETHGHLDLDGDGDYDSVADVPKNYSWSDDATDLLDYGKTVGGTRTYVNVLQEDNHVKQFLASQDQFGALSGGTSLGSTVAGTSASPVADAAHLTFTVTMWLEGWHTMERDAADASKGAFENVGDHTAVVSPVVGKIYSDSTGLTANKMFLYMGVDSMSNPIWKDVALQAGDVYYNGSAYQVVNSTATGFEDAGPKVKSALWDDLKTVGAKFNIGLSFAVPALAPIQG